MRRFRLAALAVAFVFGLPCLSAYAAGNVLVPSDDDSSPGTADDVSPIPATSSPSAVPAAPAESTSSSLLPAISPPSLGIPAPDAAASSYTPAQVNQMLEQMKADAVARATAPPNVVKMTAAIPISSPMDAILPNSLEIDIAEHYMWGPNDTTAINQNLGIPPDQVSKHCSLSVVGTTQGDDGYHAFTIGPSFTRTIVHYDGQLRNTSMYARAMCDMVPLPSQGQYVLQIGDKYSVMLASINCPTQPPNTQHLIVQYAGNGNAQCVYQQ